MNNHEVDGSMVIDVAVAQPNSNASTITNGSLNGLREIDIEELQKELPVVYDGQVPLGDLLSRVVQAIYAELSEMAETMPNMSDTARKRTLADWVVKTKKQVVKLYALVKWSRDADTVQKCMNITAFLLTQNQQFEDSIRGLNYAKESLDPARLRNHDLLTSLDVLTTGSYLRLPTCIKKDIIPISPLTDGEVRKTLFCMEEVIKYRLRMSEFIPVEMSQYRIADGRVFFIVPQLFETSLCLRGAEANDGWFFVHVEFMINIGGDLTGLQEFPRIPKGLIQRHITDEADARLAFYLPFSDGQPRLQLAEGVTDAPLVRIYNFLQIMSLSYQLEVLWYQAERMRSLGWADFLSIQMSSDRKTMTATYWIRRPPTHMPGRPSPRVSLLGGKLIIAIVDSSTRSRTGSVASRSPKAQALARLQQKSKLSSSKPSDEIESLEFVVKWEPTQRALGVEVPLGDLVLPEGTLQVDPGRLDFESMIYKVLKKHATALLSSLQLQLQHGPTRTVFSAPNAVSLIKDADSQSLRVHLCADEIVIVTIDARTGRLNLRDTGNLAAAGRGHRFKINESLNENPTLLLEALVRLRIHTIINLAEQKAKYLGLQSYRQRNFVPEEVKKLGTAARGTLYIQLSNFPDHYLVLVVTDERFRYALITTKVLSDSPCAHMIMEDIAWLDFERIHGHDGFEGLHLDPDLSVSRIGSKRKRDILDESEHPSPDLELLVDSAGFNLDTQMLRELYSYCCARVAYMNVERQFKLRGIPFTHVNPTNGSTVAPELVHVQSSLARSVPALCVQSEHILSGAPAAEAAMPNIRVIPLNWWSEEKAQVVTCVKLKYVQQPMGKTAGSTVIRPSKRIIYDTTEAVVSFLSENVNTCVDEFLEEWARVSKMVVIAREVAQMTKKKQWHDIRLLSFDLQTVEFAYASDYTVSISCEDQLSLTGGNFDLRFSRSRLLQSDSGNDSFDVFNPHDDAEPFLRNILRQGHGRLAPSMHRLVTILRDTLPIVVVLEQIRKDGEQDGKNLDTFPKASGWYRLLYGDLRHALDFRLMSGQRIAILDASHSLFEQSKPSSLVPSKPEDKNVGLQPIPKFNEIVTVAVHDGLSSDRLTPGRVAAIDVGVVCDGAGVGVLGRAIHAKVMEELKI